MVNKMQDQEEKVRPNTGCPWFHFIRFGREASMLITHCSL